MTVLRRSPIAACCLVLGLTLAATGCAKTTIDTSVTSTPSVETTTTLPAGTAAELLPRLITQVAKLSDAIGQNDNKGEQMKLINNLWTVARPEIAAQDGVVVLTFDAAIELCRQGEQFNRPADADRCLRNLTSLAGSYLVKYP